MQTSTSSVVLTILCASLYSCAKSNRSVASPARAEGATHSIPPETPVTHVVGTIRISRSVQKACGLSESEAHFKYDSAALENTDSKFLNKVAVCFLSGPLAGEEMNLIGRADPRGGEEYNIVLGGSRSENVKSHLIAQGMNADLIRATSRGEIDATGVDEAGWRQDRRVDIRLASER